MTDKMREEFKEWARSRGMSLPVNDDIHYNEWTQLAWESWQASRVSLVIDLPEAERACDLAEQYVYTAHEVGNAIAAAGLKVK